MPKPSIYLTKSDYRVARTCPTKLYYRRLGYPTNAEGNEYLEHLAQQGALVERLARLRYPNGRNMMVTGPVEQAAQATAEALDSADQITLFEATIISGRKLARIDILIKDGNAFRLLEIKSAGYKPSDAPEPDNAPFWTTRAPQSVRTDWRAHLEDITFQWLVLQERYPTATIVPTLVLVNSTQPGLASALQRLLGAPGDDDRLRELACENLVLELDVSREVQWLRQDVGEATAEFLDSLAPRLGRIGPVLTTNCRTCEYRVTGPERNGFHECWGPLADAQPHILELYKASTAGGPKGALVNSLIADGKASLYDIPVEALVKADGSVGSDAARQRRQIQQTRLNAEWVDPALGDAMGNAVYPLHFIDFETCAPTIPRYKGMRPFEQIAFQWSCHTVASPGATPVHSDWLQTADSFPNPEFLRSLRAQLGNDGTILIWSSHELTIIKAIRQQFEELGLPTEELDTWLAGVLTAEPGGRVLDMLKLAAQYYYHPLMGGKASIKLVCEAVWFEDAELRERYPMERSDSGVVESPYRSLPPLKIAGEDIAVHDGVEAILAYMAMMGDNEPGLAVDQRPWRQLLRQYCQLDTLAMVMIWEHWQRAVASLTS